MSNNSLQFTVIDDCRCNVFVSSVQIIGDSANKKVVATVSYESSLSIKGFQLDFSVPWAEVVEMLAPGDIVGTSDIDVFQQRKNIDGTWSAAIDSSPTSQQIIAWDTSGADKPIPATFDIYEEKEINGPSVLCRVVFTPNTEYSTFLDDNEIPPSHREMSNALTKAVAVSFQLGKSVPVASWSPELKDNQSIPNIIANDIFDAHHNGYNLSSDAKTAESEGLMGSIHVGDIVAAQEVIDQGLANPEIQNYNQYSVVPSVICNRVADTAPPQYESNCVGTSLKCTADSNRNLVLDVYALPSGGEDMSIATIHSPIPAKTCKIAGYHVLIELKLPFEFDLDNINQAQVNRRSGVTFASALRAILRQDPDIIMVGEVRDEETVELAIRAALTGHLVFSTIHTNDSAAGFTRLLNWGMEPFLITSTVKGILAQRLVRRLCKECREKHTVEPNELTRFGLEIDEAMEFYRAVGCLSCRNTGYQGRVGLFELIRMNNDIADLVMQQQPGHIIRKKAIESGMFSLIHDGLIKAQRGDTSLQELLETLGTESL